MIALSVAKLIFFAEKRNFSLNMQKKNVFVESLDQFRRLEVRDEPASVWPPGVTYFSLFTEFNETIIPFALVGYETGYSQLGATRLFGYLPSHIQRALME